MEDIILIDKPKGISSFDVIRKLRKILQIKKMGHAGTLDPTATGLLIIGIEKGTKKLTRFSQLDKTYLMDVLLGTKTDSGDLEGNVIAEYPVKNVDKEEVLKALKSLTGKIKTIVPKYSAIKIDGKKLYQYAREGIEIESPIREVEIHKLSLLEITRFEDKYILKIELDCQKGTYARSVAEEIGKKLKLPATVKELRRTRIGQFRVEDAQTLEDLE